MIIDKIDSKLKMLEIPRENVIFSSAFESVDNICFGDIKDELLQKIQLEDYFLLNNLLRVLSLYNISFQGIHKRLNVTVHEKIMFQPSNTRIEIKKVVSNAHALQVLDNLGYTTVKSLTGVNLEKLGIYLNKYLSPTITKMVLQALEVYTDTETLEIAIETEQGTKEKMIKINNKVYSVANDKLSVLFTELMDSGLKSVQQYFKRDSILTLQDVPSDLDIYFEDKKGVGVGKKEKVEEMLQKILKTKVAIQPERPIPAVIPEGQIIIDESLWELPKHYLDYKIDFEYLNPVIANALLSQDILYFKDLKGNLDEQLINIPSIGVSKIRQFKDFLKNFIMVSMENRIVEELNGVFMKVIKGEEYKNFDTRDLKIFSNRYNHFRGGIKVLDQVAKEQDGKITRERVRQIVRKVAKNSIPYFYGFWLELNALFYENAYFTVEQLEKVLGYESLSDEVLRFIGAVLTESKEGYYYDDINRLFHRASMEYCDDMRINMLQEAETLFQEKLYVNEENLTSLVKKIQEKYSQYPAQLIWDRHVSQLIQKGKTNLFYDTSKGKLVYKIFCMYFKEGLFLPKNVDQLIKVLNEEIPNHNACITDRNITAQIQRLAVLWDRGFYVPASLLERYGLSQFEYILEWIEQHLHDNDLFEMHLGLALSNFKEDLYSLGICNSYSLYTVLKHLQPPSLYFRKAPYVRLSKFSNVEHMTQAEKIEEFFIDQKGPVERNIALTYFTEKVGLPSYSFEQRLSNDCENVLQWSSTGYIHINYVDVQSDDLKLIYDLLKKEVNKYDEPVPITVIKRAFLLRVKIHSYHLLFALFKYYYPNDFNYYRYPLIWSNHNPGTNQSSLKMQLENYVIEQNRLLYLSEFKERFLPRGWSENEISTRIAMSTKIVPITKGGIYTHIDILGISESDIEKLSRNVHDYYKRNYEDKDVFYLPMKDHVLHEFEEDYGLPKLNFNQYWTVDLFTAVLKNSGLFFTPFFKEQVLFARENVFGIEDTHSIIAYILRTQFKGYTTLDSLKTWLEEHELMTYRLFNRILQEEGDAPYTHDGTIISLKQ